LNSAGYWGSYNVAYYPATRKVAGEVESYSNCPRAQLFKEYQGGITNTATMQHVMTWNDYKNNPISRGSPNNAIMARGDLALSPGAFGGIDSKVSSVADFANGLTSHARAGPTNDEQPNFCW
jgi:hypothetical protein